MERKSGKWIIVTFFPLNDRGPLCTAIRASDIMRSVITLILAGLLGFAGPAIAALLDKEISFSEADVQRALVKAGPQQRNYGGLLSLALPETPTITLGSPEGRVGIVTRLEVGLLGNPPVPVNVAATAGIRYDDQAKAFFLDNPVAHSVESPGLPKEAEPNVRRAVNRLLGEYFKSKPVYVLRADGNPQEIAARLLLRSIRIEPGRVVATLSPF